MTKEAALTSEGLKTHNEKEMEDILSSIRQIIEEDIQEEKESSVTPKKEPILEKKEEIQPKTDENVLELTREIKEDGTIIDREAQESEEVGRATPRPSIKEDVQDASVEEAISEEENPEGLIIEKSREDPDKLREQPSTRTEIDQKSLTDLEGSDVSPFPKKASDVEGFKEDEVLLSEETIKESSQAFADLNEATKKLVQKEVFKNPHKVGEYTVDGLMRELLKPMLKEWLDTHLPSLVKWIVTEQIEKILRQGDKK